MENYTVNDVLEIVKAQLETIPVSGQHVLTMAAAMQNINMLLITTAPKKTEEAVDNGDSI